MNYDVPLRDSGGTRTSTGAYPWRLDDDFSTIASITNVSPLPTQFIVQIKYPSGQYVLNPQTLLAGATATFDLRKIRDEQIPDRDGNKIPRSVEGGQFRWSVFGPGIGRLIGRAEMLSVSRGISSSYSCGTTCPPSFDHAWIDPDPTEITVGATDQVDAFQINVDSFANEYGPYASNVVNWWSSDDDVATVNFRTVDAIGVGSATLTATVEYPLYFWDTSTFDCIENGSNQTNVQGQASAPATVALGAVSFISPNPTVIRNGDTAKLRVVIVATSVPTNASVTLQVTLTNPNGTVSVSISPASQSVNNIGDPNAVVITTTDINFTASSNPAASVTLNGHAKLVKVGSGYELSPGQGTEKDSSNQLTVQRWPL